MKKDLPIYEIGIDLDNPDTGLTFNSLVYNPAHEISFETFSKVERYVFNDEEKIVSGVAISADTPIERYSNGEQFYVVFTKETIKDIVHDYARKGNFNKVNIEHNSNDIANGVYMVHSYQIDEKNGFTKPERFKNANDGSWIVSYKFENEELYNRVKENEFTGFSVEGNFVIDEYAFSAESEILKALDELKNTIKALK